MHFPYFCLLNIFFLINNRSNQGLNYWVLSYGLFLASSSLPLIKVLISIESIHKVQRNCFEKNLETKTRQITMVFFQDNFIQFGERTIPEIIPPLLPIDDDQEAGFGADVRAHHMFSQIL